MAASNRWRARKVLDYVLASILIFSSVAAIITTFPWDNCSPPGTAAPVFNSQAQQQAGNKKVCPGSGKVVVWPRSEGGSRIRQGQQVQGQGFQQLQDPIHLFCQQHDPEEAQTILYSAF